MVKTESAKLVKELLDKKRPILGMVGRRVAFDFGLNVVKVALNCGGVDKVKSEIEGYNRL